MVFDKKWFSKHQSKLLWLLNHSSYFRKDMGIQDCDLPYKEKIVRITPNSFTWRTGEREFMTDFRTHDKFGKRLYYGFYPIWDLAHKFDMKVANRFVPAMNLGFDTLTAYPEAGGGGGNTTCDGYMNYAAAVGVSWASTVGASAGNETGVSNTDESYIYIRKGNGSTFDWSLQRSIYTFDTSSITAAATISSSVMSLRGSFKQDDASITPNINIYLATPASNNNLVDDDFDQIGSTAQCDTAITYAGFSTSGYNDFTFNATGRGNISKTGVSKFGARNANYDVSVSTPSMSSLQQSYLYGYFADQTGTTNDPKLVVTYTLPSAFVPKIIFM